MNTVKKLVSVYIPAYNAANDIAACIQSVLAQTYPVDEVLVVDDGSTDETAHIAAYFPVRVLKQGKRGGLASARNTAVLAAKGEFVASLDADCLADPNWLSECVRHFERLNVVGVGGRVVDRGGSLADKWRAVHLIQNPGENKDREVSYLAGCNTVYRKKTLLDAGLYEARFKTYHEDTDMGRRLLRKNSNVLFYTPKAVITHIKKDSLYSVMQTCWNFRHKAVPPSAIKLIQDIVSELKHALSIIIKDIRNKEFCLLPIDFVYFFYQAGFNVKYFLIQF